MVSLFGFQRASVACKTQPISPRGSAEEGSLRPSFAWQSGVFCPRCLSLGHAATLPSGAESREKSVSRTVSKTCINSRIRFSFVSAMFTFPSTQPNSQGAPKACGKITLAEEKHFLAGARWAWEIASLAFAEGSLLTCVTLQERRYVCSNPECKHKVDLWLAPGEKAQPRCQCNSEMKRPYHKPRVRTWNASPGTDGKQQLFERTSAPFRSRDTDESKIRFDRRSPEV